MTLVATSSETLLDTVVLALRACDTAPDGVERPAAILWTDPKGEWRSVVRLLRDRMPELITLGEYRLENRSGPAIWIRCMVDRTLDEPALPNGAIPIVYLPGVGRQELRAGEDCPRRLQPLIELMFRGTMWQQRSGHDWTVTAFLSSDHGLGLDLARDEATLEAMSRALPELAVTPLQHLRDHRLDADHFDRLLAGDVVRDLLRWMSDPSGTKQLLGRERWGALCNQCRSRFEFNPEKDGEVTAGELLGLGEGAWAEVWQRYAEAPQGYPGIPALLRRSKPSGLLFDQSRWPDVNDDQEDAARKSLGTITRFAHAQACDLIEALEREHGVRRGWIWSRLGQSPMATVLEPLSRLARTARNTIGGATPEDFADAYRDKAWEADAAAWEAVAAAPSADVELINDVVTALLVQWLDDSARAFQRAVDRHPLPRKAGQPLVEAEPGMCLLFADGLRFDLAMRLGQLLERAGMRVRISHRWAALPTVTATAKPAVTPVAELVEGSAMPDDFCPTFAESARPASAPEIRSQLEAQGYQVVSGEDFGWPATATARGWVESGAIDTLGHKLQHALARQINHELERLATRITKLLEGGWRAVRIVTDHGWLYSPGGLPKIDLPRHLTESRWSRCAAILGQSHVSVPIAPWHWNAGERFATAPGAACFNVSPCYSHGGISIQECLIPDLMVERAHTPSTHASIRAVIWRGMRCFVEATGGEVEADLRLESPSGDSVAAARKRLDADGTVSLVVKDDRYESANLVVVLIGADGMVLAQRKTKVGVSA